MTTAARGCAGASSAGCGTGIVARDLWRAACGARLAARCSWRHGSRRHGARHCAARWAVAAASSCGLRRARIPPARSPAAPPAQRGGGLGACAEAAEVIRSPAVDSAMLPNGVERDPASLRPPYPPCRRRRTGPQPPWRRCRGGSRGERRG